MRAFHENPNHIHTELTFINLKSALSQNVCFCRPLNYLKPHRLNSVNSDQIAPVGAV